MTFGEELSKLSLGSESDPYGNVKEELLKLVEVIKKETENDAEKGLFKTEFVINGEEYPTIDYIYKDLGYLKELSHLLSNLLDTRFLGVIVTETEYNNIKVEFRWTNGIHTRIFKDLTSIKR